MDSRNMNKAMDIYAKLMMGEEISRHNKETASLYEEYYQNAEVYELLGQLLKRLNLHIYEYKEALYLTPGESNRVFGYTNEELKRMMGLRYNKELYTAYYVMYQILLCFYQDSATYQYREYVRLAEVVKLVSDSLAGLIQNLQVYAMDEIQENSFKTIALCWDNVVLLSGEEEEQLRASRFSQMGFVKLVFNFLISQKLFVELEGRYYPTNRFKALAEQYFEEHRGEIYEILERRHEDAQH